MRKKIKQYQDHTIHFRPIEDGMDRKDDITHGNIWDDGSMIFENVPQPMAKKIIKEWNAMVELLTRDDRKIKKS